MSNQGIQPQQTQLQDFIEQEVQKVRGKYVPVKAGLLRRALIRKMRIKKMHPNPDDEFCDPKIGPALGIVNKYVREFSRLEDNPSAALNKDITVNEPIQVQRIRPSGYMILNGHHRWLAAHQTGVTMLKVRIVDLTQESDIRRTLQASHHDRRVTMDLDEVVFRPEGKDGYEKKPKLLGGRIFKEQIRMGFPTLCQFLSRRGYDVWVYTSNYYSQDYLSRLFRLYRCPVTGVITGLSRKGPDGAKAKKYMEQMFEEKYQTTLHVDNENVLQSFTKSQEFKDIPLNLADEIWSAAVSDAVQKLDTEMTRK
jgi:hypothetical protein